MLNHRGVLLMIKERYISVVEVNGMMVNAENWRINHNRRNAFDYLTFKTKTAFTPNSVVSLKFGDSKKLITFFKGKLLYSGMQNVAINGHRLLSKLIPKSYIDTTVHNVIRDLCSKKDIKDPFINFTDASIEHFQAEQNLLTSFNRILNTLHNINHKEVVDISYYFDPSGRFYFGVFRDWKKKIETFQDRDHIISVRQFRDGYQLCVIPTVDIYHSQKVKILSSIVQREIFTIEEVCISFKSGKHYQTLYIK